MEFNSLNKNAKSYWLLQNVILVVVLITGGVIPIILVDSSIKLVVGLSVGIPLILLSILLIIFPLLKYKFYKYYYDEERVIIKRGVIFRHEIVIPVCQIQDLHVFEGPIMMAFKLKGVIFSTAGSNFELVGLNKEVAEKLVDEVESYLKKRVEVLSNEKV